MGSSDFLKRLAKVKIMIEVNEGRVIVSGREYFADHSYIVGFDNATIKISPINLVVKVEYNEFPEVSTEGTLIRIGGNINVIDQEPKVVLSHETADEDHVVVSNVDMKVRSENNVINVLIEGWKSYRASEFKISINSGKDMIINVMTRPITSMWIYSRTSKVMKIRKSKDKILIDIEDWRR